MVNLQSKQDVEDSDPDIRPTHAHLHGFPYAVHAVAVNQTVTTSDTSHPIPASVPKIWTAFSDSQRPSRRLSRKTCESDHANTPSYMMPGAAYNVKRTNSTFACIRQLFRQAGGSARVVSAALT